MMITTTSDLDKSRARALAWVAYPPVGWENRIWMSAKHLIKIARAIRRHDETAGLTVGLPPGVPVIDEISRLRAALKEIRDSADDLQALRMKEIARRALEEMLESIKEEESP